MRVSILSALILLSISTVSIGAEKLIIDSDGAAFNDDDAEAKRRLIRRNPQQIYVPPAAKFRETSKVDEPATVLSLPETKFVEVRMN